MSARPSWNAGRIIFALARHFDWFQNTMMTEEYVDGGLADLVFITRAGQLTEIEIKVSKGDWTADKHKGKWKKPRPHVSRFFYAIPETLESKIPPPWMLPDGAGILVIRAGEFRDTVDETVSAKRVRAKKIEPGRIADIHRRSYFRFWRAEINRLRQRFEDNRRRLVA